MKKFVLSFLMICLCCIGTLAFSGCGNTDNPPAHSHDYTEEKAESAYLKSNATCTAKAVYYKSCACGEKGTETFEYGETKEHKYVNSVCENCGDKIIVSSEGLSYRKVENTYIVVGLGDFNAEDLVIPDYYNELPVVGVDKLNGFGYSTEQIKRIIIGNNVQYIAESAFRSIPNYEYLVIGTSVKEIREGAFGGADKLKEIVFNAIECESVHWTAFEYGGDYEKKVVFGNMVKIVPAYLLSGEKTTFNEIVFEEDSVCEKIEKKAFLGSKIEEIVLPNSLREIGEGAFKDCVKLKSIQLPNNVITVSEYAFSGCSSLENVGFSNNLQSIGAYAFEKCPKISNITLFENLITIGKDAFTDCALVQSIIVPDTVEVIGDGAFSGCTGLKTITFGKELKKLGAYVISGSSLTEIRYNSICVDDINPSYLPFLGAHNDIGFSIVIGRDVERIPANLFNGANSAISYPTIASLRFEEDSKCESIGERAFASCRNIECLAIPRSLKVIEESAFEETNVNEIHIEDVAAWCGIEFENIESNPMYRQYHKIFIDGTETTDLIIPDNVEIIRKYAFYGCNVKNITIGTGCKTIQQEAFRHCCYVERINFNAINCDNFTSNSYIFSNVGNATNLIVKIGKNVTNIPDYIFGSENSLDNYANNLSVKIEFEDSEIQLRIGKHAFSFFEELTEITIPKNVTEIDEAAFYGTALIEATFVNTEGWQKYVSDEVSTIWNLSTKNKAAEYLLQSYHAKWVYNP